MSQAEAINLVTDGYTAVLALMYAVIQQGIEDATDGDANARMWLESFAPEWFATLPADVPVQIGLFGLED